MVTNRIIFFATSVQPNPEEIDYWVDLSDNPYGGSIKYFNGTEWVRLAASGGVPDLNNYYTKTQVNKLLNDKANIGDVDSKVDDEEVKDVIKDIQFNTSNPNGITMVMFKYDGSNKTVSIPVASTSSAGIITSKDFLDFVKQHQLQELHTEMIDTFADIRAKYQKKLIAGLNIEIDQETNVISASGDLAVQWDNITNKPDFKPVATSGDYNDLINKLKPGKDVSISEDNVISIAIDSDSLEQSLATLQSNIDKEAATARAAETKLGNDIATEKNRAQSAEQTISTNLQNEINRSTQVDTQHTNAINKEVQDRKEAIATEVSDRNAAILVETNRAKAKEEELDNKITDHTAATNAALALKADKSDTYTKAQVDAQVKVNEDKLTIINGNESTTGSIANAIKQAKSYTDTTVTAEQTRAENAEQKLTSDLASEVTRAKGAESANTTAIANEVERATGVEETLNSNITQLQTQKVDKVEGKGLSTNDYTTPEKNKLAAIEAEANKYVLPAATASALGGVKIGSNITLANGGTISITKANVTSALGVDPTTTYVKKAGDTMTGILNIKNSEGAQLELFSTASDGGAYMRFYPNNQTDDKWYLGVGTNQTLNLGYNTVTKASFGDGQLSLTTSANLAPIKTNSTTLCTNLNADMVDGYGVSNFNTDSVSIKRSINSVNQSNAENWIKLCTLPLTSQITTQDKRVVFEIVGGTDVGEKYAYYATLTASTRVTENVELRILNSVDTISIATFIAGYVITSDKVEIWIRTSNQWGASTNIVCKYASTNADDILSSPATTQRPSNFVLGNIKTLDAPDWYGVSWSETSSNPDCTRIGNMDMHRSLPIQSMMKPFDITNIKNTVPEIILPIDDQFQKTSYANANNNQWSIVSTDLDNIMIRIPEFWYTDEYVPKSNTHNLKICPHAKPGWYHHKEAYVSAYELCETSPSSGKVCSAKGLIPLVGRTREVLRKAVRGSGFDGEAKWNLYTYEEHRAICHLFLVEYATRNSQKAVNTELTPEGFRQGGLGSGCTTGTATINGAQTWSFIPTGSSDSLGSGSGEVTVTIQQTDSSGSNTSTITRKCNRYRGIENPFGHIWKHTDDVISVYGNGYRTWYKSVKPNQFATNKNTSYKPFCASTMVSSGYKTEIKATPTCDFFAISVSGGSETTYWCDYNWNNTDTSEHCLLIGGGSDTGGSAGLFFLDSANGVGVSSAYIGSRLTYLPWAE